MAINLTDFDKIWASNSPLTPYSFSDANYEEGWNFVGATPPARQMWDGFFKWSDEKQQYIVQNFLPLSGGTMTGTLTLDDGGTALSTAGGTMTGIITAPQFFANRGVTNDYLAIAGGTDANSGAMLTLSGKDRSGDADGQFRLRANNGVDDVSLIGKPDGTLTWGGVSIPNRAYGINALSSIAGENTYTFTMTASSAVIFAKRGNNASMSMVTYWDSSATVFATAGTNPISITTSANSSSVTITNTSSSAVSLKIINAGTL